MTKRYPIKAVSVLGLCSALICSTAWSQTCYDHIEATAPETNFILHDDGTVSDKTTGLMWMRCNIGQTWSNDTCSGFVNTGFYWQDALREADGFEYAGYSDWRLPNIKELATLVELKCASPAINEVVFPGTVNKWYWSSTARLDGYDVSEMAYTVDFRYGRIVNAFKEATGPAIRMVRMDQ